MGKRKFIPTIAISLCLVIMLSIIPVTNVYAVDINDPGVLLKQTASGRCTHAAAVNMLRRRAIIDGNPEWANITEATTDSDAWNSGLKWSFDCYGMSVSHDKLSGNSAQKKQTIINLLNNHPEGIVGYNRSYPHAVLITSYDSSNDTFYCYDPTGSRPDYIISLTGAYLPGSTQDERIGNLDDYWYISNKSGGGPGLPPPPPSPPTGAWVSVDKTLVGIGENIVFSCGATGATSYTITINKNASHILTQTISSGFSKSFDTAGSYSAQITAHNSAGIATSNWVDFVVGVGSRTVSGDFNGDGKSDYATLYDFGKGRSQWHVFLSTETAFSEEVWLEQMGEGWYYASAVSGRVVAGDFNGDGLDDVATMYDYGNGEMKIHVFLSTGTSFNGWNTWIHSPTGYGVSAVTDRIVAGDFNGDGKDDIAAMFDYGNTEMKIHVFLSTGTSFSGWYVWNHSPSGYDAKAVIGRIVSGDFDGNGKDDIAAMYDYGNGETKLHLFLSIGTSFAGWYVWYHSPSGYGADAITGRFAAGDFDGNGKDDIVAMFDYGNGENRIHVFLSTGTSFSGYYTWYHSPTGYGANAVTGRFVAGDFNSDGKDDIAVTFDYSSSKIMFHLYISDGTKFASPWWNEIIGYDAKRTTGMKAYTDNYTAGYTFKKINSYDIIYNANGGNGTPPTQKKWYNIELKLSDIKPTRTGYTFLGWSASSTATSAAYQAGGSYTNNTNVTLYAVWKNSDEHTITSVSTINGNYNFYTQITNPVNGSVAVIATYNSTGKLVEMQNIPIISTTTAFSRTLRKDLGATHAKVMLWDGLNTMQPLCDPEPIELY